MDIEKGNIGIFDSGLGGLWILKTLREKFPEFNYVFFGDQAHVPYGTKTTEELFAYTTDALRFLYKEQNCVYVLLACNTTSSTIYPQLRAWVEAEFPGRKLFGIVHPTVLAIESTDPIVAFGTVRTIESHAYRDELMKEKNMDASSIHEIALPELASIIERGEEAEAYLASFAEAIPETVRTGILGCTHYGIVRSAFEKAFPHISTWVSQEAIVPERFGKYFAESIDARTLLLEEGALRIYVSKKSDVFDAWLAKWYGEGSKAQII